MLRFFKLKTARAAAMAIVPAFINHTRHHYGARSISIDVPFVTGFVTIFITDVALERVYNLNNDVMGLVQADVWAVLLNDTPEHIGEKISFQSGKADPAFLFGCQNAKYFCHDLFTAISIFELENLAKTFCVSGQYDESYFNALCSGNNRRERILQDWSHRFEAFL